MSKKIKIDIKKENPLITILKADKIPCIRRSNEGFKNYNQDDYFQKHLDEKTYKEIEDRCQNIKGCFVFLGGIQGVYVSGFHSKEKLWIGYLEPDAKVFATYARNSKDNFTYMTARQRFDEAYLEYGLEMCNEDQPWDLEDFDLSTEVIAKREDIKTLCEIEMKDFYKLLPFSNDGMLKIFSPYDIMCFDINYLPKNFYNILGVKDINDFNNTVSAYIDEEPFKTYMTNFYTKFRFGLDYEADLALVKGYIQAHNEYNKWVEEYNSNSFAGSIRLGRVNIYKDIFICSIKDVDFKAFTSKVDDESLKFLYKRHDIECFEIDWRGKDFERFCVKTKTPYWQIFKKGKKELDKDMKKWIDNWTMDDVYYRKDNKIDEKSIFDIDIARYLFVYYDAFKKYEELFGEYKTASIKNLKNTTFIKKLAFCRNVFEGLKSNEIDVNFSRNMDVVYAEKNGIVVEYNYPLNDYIISYKRNDELVFENYDKLDDMEIKNEVDKIVDIVENALKIKNQVSF
jgi:hypothetical protein